MPIYEFKCTECENVEEHLMRLSDPPPAACGKCGSPMSKLISQTSFALKGSGWYVTDYKKSDAPKAKDEGGSKSESGSEAASPSPSANKENPTATTTAASSDAKTGKPGTSSPSPSPATPKGNSSAS